MLILIAAIQWTYLPRSLPILTAVNNTMLFVSQGEQAHAGFPEAAYAAMAEQLARAGYRVVVVEQVRLFLVSYIGAWGCRAVAEQWWLSSRHVSTWYCCRRTRNINQGTRAAARCATRASSKDF